MPIRVEPKIKKKKKKVTPLGRLKKQGPKPGSFSYQQQETMKPGYKVPPMMVGGEIRPFKDKDLSRKQRPIDRIRSRDRLKPKPKKISPANTRSLIPKDTTKPGPLISKSKPKSSKRA